MSVFSLGKTIKLLEKAHDQGVSISFTDNELSVHVEKGKAIDPLLLHELKSNKPSLIYYFTNHITKEQKSHLSQTIQKIDRTGLQKIPASFAQERLWFIDQLEGSVQYHLPSVFRLKGTLRRDALDVALRAIVNRHEVLRTVIREMDGQPLQYIQDENSCKVNFIDGHQYLDNPEALQQAIKELIRKPFNLATDHMLRIDLISIDEEQHILIATMHHIASDAWSTPVLVKEVVELYSAFIENREPLLLPLKIQYADYAIWQRNYLQGEILNKKLGYWKEKLKGLTPLQLPTDFPRPAIQSSKGANAYFSIDKETTEQLHLLRQQQGSTLFMTLIAVYKIMLSRYSSQQDICVGTSIASREKQELENLIGFFVNTLTLRCAVNMDASFADLLYQVKTTTLQAYEHQDVPFEKVVDAVLTERDASRNPLFQVMLVLANTPETSQLKLGDLELYRESYQPDISKFDLTFFINETGDGLQCSVQFCTDLFKEETITRMISHFKQLISTIVKSPHRRIGSLCMLTETEQQQLLVEFNSGAVVYPKDKTIVDLFEEQAARTPDETALVFEEERLTYKQLNERSNQLAHYLRTKGVKEDSLVPLCVERSHHMLIGMLGILKAGGAYVPIEPDFPQKRKDFVLEDTQAAVVVSTEESSSALSVGSGIHVIEIDDAFSPIKAQPTHNLASSLRPHHLAYVIYTSGSTGRPKGVMIEHRNLVDYVFGLKQNIQIDQCRSYALVSSIATDLGNTVIYPSLVFGGALHVFSRESVSNIEHLHDYFAEHSIDCLKIVPSHWKALSAPGQLLLPVRLLVFGGEALQSELIEQIGLSGSGCKVVNHYGPTETTIGKLLHQVSADRKYNKTIPIGKPFSNNGVYILSKDMELCPVGVAGQLYIWGDGVARGYLNNGELTDQKFVNSRYNKKDRRPMYGTGDLVRYLPDGNIEFIGRVDDQVKIRGYRVELGEIENALSQINGVKQAAVLAKEDSDGNKRLVGYIIGAEDHDKESMVSYLKERLPEYMVPGQWVEMDEFPLLPNGKIDRKSLPDPETSGQLSGQYTAPRTDVEAKLAALWQDVLEVDQVGVHDDFFELGGHSLLAVRLISAIRKEFVVEMPISDIFDYPTVAQLAAQIGHSSEADVLPSIEAVKSRPERIPLSFSQERLWFIDRLEGSVQYHVTTVLRLNGKLDKEALEYSLQTIVNRHEVLRTVILEEDGEPYQSVKEENTWKLSLIDGSIYKADGIHLQQDIKKYIRKPFDLSKDDMMRAALISIDKEEHILIVTIHHIASDGWSKSVLVKEVVALYGSYREGRKAELEAIQVQYADYAIWQRQYLEGDILNKKIAYWKDKLHNTAPLQLPTDYPRPAVQSVRGARMSFDINKELSSALQQLSQQNGCTVFMTLLASLKVLLHRYSGQQDICIGSPIANRMQQELEQLIGFFVNTLALRSEINPDASFKELLQQVKQTTMEAYQHQEAPFEKVVEAVVKGRDMSRNPLFQVMFVLRNTPEVPELHFRDLTFSGVGFEHATALFDMTFFITETDNGLEGSVEYSTDLFSADTVTRMTAHFKELLSSIVKDPLQCVGKLPFLTKAEEHQLLVDFNDTTVNYPVDKTIVDLLEEQVLKTPAKVAMVFQEEIFTYETLNKKVNQLANYLLQKYNLKADETVAVFLDRSSWSAIAMLAIIKTGACYVPIDVKLPENRLKYIIEDASPKVIITSENLSQKHASLLAGEHIIVQSLPLDGFDPSDPDIIIRPDDLSYVIYTSGSTGMPKGVMQTHRMLYNLIQWDNDRSGLPWSMKITEYASFAFDSSLHDLCFSLTNGGTCYVLHENIRLDFPGLAQYIVDHQIEIVSLPFSALSNFFNIIDLSLLEGHNIKAIISTGEQLVIGSKLESFLELNPHIPIHNLYGPSETHVVTASSFTAEKKLPKHIPIGKPISNTDIYILDKYHNPVPLNVTGEIFIGGDNLARGYLKNEQMTKQKFVTSFFNSNRVLYKTGDMGRWLSDGNIEYLGRFDDQVKIRGYRIELGEIESLLHQCELVKQAVVLAKDDKEGNKRLVGYIVPEKLFDRKAIVAHLKGMLPEYMIPALWVELEHLPLTPNGKVDKRALPDPDAGELLKNEYVAPRNETEALLVEMWQDLLGVKQVGVYDNFFELGGHSLMVIKMVANIKKRFLLSIPISALFQFTCINDLSKYLEWEIHSIKDDNSNPETDKTTEEDKSSFEVLNL
jgi:amino acid adenylation domain-containing protein